jgi:hypothetical protein
MVEDLCVSLSAWNCRWLWMRKRSRMSSWMIVSMVDKTLQVLTKPDEMVMTSSILTRCGQ